MIGTIRKTLALFEPRERLELSGLFTIMVVVALVQTAGIASILPFMSLAANPELVTQNEWLSRLYDRGGFDGTRAFLLFSGVLVLAIMAASNALGALEHWLMYRFVWRKQHRLSVKLLGQYLDEPYTFYLSHNTAGLEKNILAEVSEVVNGVLMPVLRLFAQLLVIAFVLALLVLVDPRVALSAILILGGSYGVIYRRVRRKQRKLGKVRRKANDLRFKSAAEAFGSIKETRVLGREREFLRRFAGANMRYSNANASNAIVRDIPRYGLETLAFGGIVLIAVYLVQTRQDFGQAVAILSLYGLAGYRLMPALQHVFRGLAQIRFYLPALDGLHADLERRGARRAAAPAAGKPGPLTYERGIVLDGIGYSYPGSDTPVLSNVTLGIPKYGSVAFVGATGCGKTTLVDILLGLLEPQHGRIRVDDRVLTPEDLPAWRERLGYVPQHIYLCDDSITRNIALGVPDKEIDHSAVERASRVAHLHDFIAGLEIGYDTVIGERGVRLSGGQRQRIGIARALYRDPDVLVMDEATSALDGVTEEAIVQAIGELASKKTIVLVAHRLTTIRTCEAVYLFDRGEVVASGTYSELLRTNLKFRAFARGGLGEAAAS